MALEQFTYKTKSGRVVRLPKFDNIPFDVVRKLRKESEEEQFFGMIEQVADEKMLALIDSLGQAEIIELMEAWQKDGGVEMGKSTPS